MLPVFHGFELMGDLIIQRGLDLLNVEGLGGSNEVYDFFRLLLGKPAEYNAIGGAYLDQGLYRPLHGQGNTRLMRIVAKNRCGLLNVSLITLGIKL